MDNNIGTWATQFTDGFCWVCLEKIGTSKFICLEFSPIQANNLIWGGASRFKQVHLVLLIWIPYLHYIPRIVIKSPIAALFLCGT